MIVGVGVDVVPVDRIARAVDRLGVRSRVTLPGSAHGVSSRAGSVARLCCRNVDSRTGVFGRKTAAIFRRISAKPASKRGAKPPGSACALHLCTAECLAPVTCPFHRGGVETVGELPSDASVTAAGRSPPG